MVEGVTKGFEKTLEINGVGYRAQKQGDKLVLSLGYSHPVEMVDPEGIVAETPSNTKIIIKGIDKEVVGRHAANIRKLREPEPYKGKGIKYENETIRRKEGKAGK
jgi:large subunit ribosomal protein L6